MCDNKETKNQEIKDKKPQEFDIEDLEKVTGGTGLEKGSKMPKPGVSHLY